MTENSGVAKKKKSFWPSLSDWTGEGRGRCVDMLTLCSPVLYKCVRTGGSFVLLSPSEMSQLLRQIYSAWTIPVALFLCVRAFCVDTALTSGNHSISEFPLANGSLCTHTIKFSRTQPSYKLSACFRLAAGDMLAGLCLTSKAGTSSYWHLCIIWSIMEESCSSL